MSDSNVSTENYDIGAVVRRTGLTAQCIRVWEKRYQAVMPIRTATKRRLYNRTDVERLSLLKRLTDAGHSIRTIANLDLKGLQGLIADSVRGGHLGAAGFEGVRDTNRLLVVGSGPDTSLVVDDTIDCELLPELPGLSESLRQKELPQADLLLIRTDSYFSETKSHVEELIARTGAAMALVVFQYASRKDGLTDTPANGRIFLLRGPVSPARLRRECCLHLRMMKAVRDDDPLLHIGPVPDLLFDSRQLAEIEHMETAVNCDCPRHLVGLIRGLRAFEAYSESCEDRNAEDSVVHSFLHRTTAEARRKLEDALLYLMKAEGIDLK